MNMKRLILMGLLALTTGCATQKIALRDIQDYDQAIKIAETNGMDTKAMHQHLVEMMVSYIQNPGVDPYVKAMKDAATAQQMQALNGSMALIQQQQQYQPPMPMSPGQYQRGMQQFGR